MKNEFRTDRSHSFILHDSNSTTEADTAVAAALILQDEVENGVRDCRLQPQLAKMKLFKSHIRNVYVAYKVRPSPMSEDYFVPLTTDAENVKGSSFDILNLKAQLAYVTIARGQQVADQLAKLEKGLCEVKADLLKTKVADAIGNDNKLAFSTLWGPGHLAVIRGSVVYKITGTKVPVKLRAPLPGLCSAEVPITALYPNRTTDAYCDPHSLLLKRFPSNITCDSM